MQGLNNSGYDIDSAWSNFLEDGTVNNDVESTIIHKISNNDEVPKGTDIYISTKTKIAYLNSHIDLDSTFWNINIIPYHEHKEGVVKKQMKFNFTEQETLQIVSDKLVGLNNVDEQIITQIMNPSGRIKFKDIRKISIGLSQKDIMSYRSKKKSAFYNCFVLIIRVEDDNKFKEIHVKVFNTGKLEIPGIREDALLYKTLDLLIDIIKKATNLDDLAYDRSKSETVLINSNFNCGFYINRDKLLGILKYKYHIDCIFDSCQYPGIQCKYNFTTETGVLYRISFMIFRTGSVLIVGKCDEDVLYKIYNNIKQILIDEYSLIKVNNMEYIKEPPKVKKIKKKVIYID